MIEILVQFLSLIQVINRIWFRFGFVFNFWIRVFRKIRFWFTFEFDFWLKSNSISVWEWDSDSLFDNVSNSDYDRYLFSNSVMIHFRIQFLICFMPVIIIQKSISDYDSNFESDSKQVSNPDTVPMFELRSTSSYDSNLVSDLHSSSFTDWESKHVSDTLLYVRFKFWIEFSFNFVF